MIDQRPCAGARIPGGQGRRRPQARQPRWRAIYPGWWSVRRAFAEDPRATNLVGIKPGRMTGNWRDSEQGLGTGRYAYDVNAALVPAALAAAARLLESGLLDEYLDADQRRTLAQAGRAGAQSGRRAPRRCSASTFPPRGHALTSPPMQRRSVLTVGARCAALNAGPLAFHALSLDEQGPARPDPAFGRGLPVAADRARAG